MTTTINQLISELRTNPQWKGRNLRVDESTNGRIYIHISWNRFFDRICENGWMWGATAKITIDNKNIIHNITDYKEELIPLLSQVLGEKAVLAYRDRCAWYWGRLKAMTTPINPTEYRQLETELEQRIINAEN